MIMHLEVQKDKDWDVTIKSGDQSLDLNRAEAILLGKWLDENGFQFNSCTIVHEEEDS